MSEQTYVEWMAQTYERLIQMDTDPAACELCSGTGIEPVMCCNGAECACRGLPVDFEACSKGHAPPKWFVSGKKR